MTLDYLALVYAPHLMALHHFTGQSSTELESSFTRWIVFQFTQFQLYCHLGYFSTKIHFSQLEHLYFSITRFPDSTILNDTYLPILTYFHFLTDLHGPIQLAARCYRFEFLFSILLVLVVTLMAHLYLQTRFFLRIFNLIRISFVPLHHKSQMQLDHYSNFLEQTLDQLNHRQPFNFTLC